MAFQEGFSPDHLAFQTCFPSAQNLQSQEFPFSLLSEGTGSLPPLPLKLLFFCNKKVLVFQASLSFCNKKAWAFQLILLFHNKEALYNLRLSRAFPSLQAMGIQEGLPLVEEAPRPSSSPQGLPLRLAEQEVCPIHPHWLLFWLFL